MIPQEAVIAANRFGFGADPDAMSAIAKDPKAWVKRQIVPEKQLPRTARSSAVDDGRPDGVLPLVARLPQGNPVH